MLEKRKRKSLLALFTFSTHKESGFLILLFFVNTFVSVRCIFQVSIILDLLRTVVSYYNQKTIIAGHLMEKIEAENLLHRAFSVFLFNSKYELLLQQRSATKVTFPLVWTNTCCSHPLYRDSELIEENALGVRNAAQRKLLDELGIPAEDVPVDQFTPLGRILYKAPSDGKWGEHELDYLLFTVREVNMKPNPDEVADVKYVNREQLKELLRKADAGEGGLKLSPWFRLVVDNFLFKWWDHLEKGTLEEVIDMKTIHKLT
uniref:isopentenyl-diphosphate Delta-isomerase n=1 Tax=Nicotiana sylvestris TaxID=4096 RepID=A0A1U7Z1F4_NICSY|nr:PREDICTED: isopentenyl-diphosphate Delta-isomerase I [Nicotiana sylvestris]